MGDEFYVTQRIEDDTGNLLLDVGWLVVLGTLHNGAQDAHVVAAPWRGHGNNSGIGSLVVVDLNLAPDAFRPATPEEVEKWRKMWMDGR